MTSPEQASDRFTRLLDIARGAASGSAEDLGPDERLEVERLQALLEAIDASWSAPPSAQDSVRAAFFRRLAATRPTHPWIESQTIRTLGDLLQAAADAAPALPARSLARLQDDPTPIEEIIDPEQRTVLFGRAITRASVPTTTVSQLVHWLNRALVDLIQTPVQGSTPSLIFTRRQATRRQRRGE